LCLALLLFTACEGDGFGPAASCLPPAETIRLGVPLMNAGRQKLANMPPKTRNASAGGRLAAEFLEPRSKTRRFEVGGVAIGGNAPVSIQSMTNTDTRDAAATLAQVGALAAAGCEIVRVAVPDVAAVAALPELVEGSPLPVIADVHFDYTLALGALEAGVHGLRVNPGTIRSPAGLRRVARAAAEHDVPLRVGVNGGSLEPEVLAQYGRATPEALVESALRGCALFERHGCRKIKVSLKTSSVPVTVAAYRLFAARTDYPLHVGITEAGSVRNGTIKSAVGIGALLLEGIGNTIRVSLTGDPVQELPVAQRILEAAGLRAATPEIVACPTCGRTEVDLEPLVTAVEDEIDRLKGAGKRIDMAKVAIMGCVVNGPGEARDADVGIAGGCGKGVLFRHGEVVRSVPESELLACLLEEIRSHAH